MLERSIEQNLDTLPSPLRRTWQERFDATSDAELPQFASELENFIVERGRALVGKAPALFDGMRHLISDEAAIAKTMEIIHGAEGDPELYIGEGKTAHVYRDPKTNAVCYKYVHNFQEYAAWNNIGSEGKYLGELEDVVVDGARAPQLFGVIDLPETKVIAMEYIDAPSLALVMERNRPLPENFDAHVFIAKLRAFMAAVHERGIYHRDLHEGNVLVGADNTPYVIDFGKAIRSISPEFAYEAFDRTNTNRVVLASDEDWMYALETKLKSHMLERKRKHLRAA